MAGWGCSPCNSLSLRKAALSSEGQNEGEAELFLWLPQLQGCWLTLWTRQMCGILGRMVPILPHREEKVPKTKFREQQYTSSTACCYQSRHCEGRVFRAAAWKDRRLPHFLGNSLGVTLFPWKIKPEVGKDEARVHLHNHPPSSEADAFQCGNMSPSSDAGAKSSADFFPLTFHINWDLNSHSGAIALKLAVWICTKEDRGGRSYLGSCCSPVWLQTVPSWSSRSTAKHHAAHGASHPVSLHRSPVLSVMTQG